MSDHKPISDAELDAMADLADEPGCEYSCQIADDHVPRLIAEVKRLREELRLASSNEYAWDGKLSDE